VDEHLASNELEFVLFVAPITDPKDATIMESAMLLVRRMLIRSCLLEVMIW
jgi:hypothetical protein